MITLLSTSNAVTSSDLEYLSKSKNDWQKSYFK